MRRHAAALVALALTALATPAHADEYSDFRVPDHRYLSSTGSLSTRLSRDYLSVDDAARRRTSSAFGNAGFLWARHAEPSRTTLRASASGTTRGEWTRISDQFAPIGGPRVNVVDAGSRRIDDSRISTSLDYMRYPWAPPLGVGMSLSARHVGEWQRRETSSTTRQLGTTPADIAEYRWDRRTFTNHTVDLVGTIAIGIGRVRNATGVYEAHVLEQRLVETGALERELSREARRRLAELMSVRSDFADTRDRRAKDLWSEVERVAREDGALSERGLGPYSVWRGSESPFPGEPLIATDGLPTSPRIREVGLEIRVEVGGRHTRLDRENDLHAVYTRVVDGVVGPVTEIRSDSDDEISIDEAFLGAVAEWHRPLGHRWQIDAEAVGRAPIDDDRDGVETLLLLDACWLVSDRWFGTLSVNQSRILLQDDVGGVLTDFWHVQYGGQLRYALTERLAAAASLTESQSSSGVTAGFTRRTDLTVGLSYRFAGLFEMPGFMLPVGGPP